MSRNMIQLNGSFKSPVLYILKNQKLYSCEDCEFETPQKSFLMKHKENEHQMIEYSCESCDFYTTSRGVPSPQTNNSCQEQGRQQK